jgi:geranylgeranyl transferase type-2 subunit beta
MAAPPRELLKDLHIRFLRRLLFTKTSYEYMVSFPIRTNTYYWGLSALYLLGGLDGLDPSEKAAIVSEILDSQTAEGGIAGHRGGDAHVHYTLSGIQALILLDAFDRLDAERIVNWIKTLQLEDGSFQGDKWGEVDTRFVYCALASLALLGRLDAVDVRKAADWIRKCQNFDGGFGVIEGCESHAGQVFTSVGALVIAKAIDEIDKDALGFWLSERQDPKGGFNGRPEKLPDVCYSWWVGAPIAMIGKQNWVDADKLEEFVLSAQDTQDGGIADRPGNFADPFHTFLGVAGLTLFGKLDVPRMNPVYALPVEVVERHLSRINKLSE